MSTTITYADFRARFTDAEKTRVEFASLHDPALAKTHPSNLLAATLRALLKDAEASGRVDLASARSQGGVHMLAQAAILDGETAEERTARALQILALPTPVPAATAFGFAVGQAVLVLPPFDAAFPGPQVVEAFTDSAVQITGGSQFEPQFLEAA